MRILASRRCLVVSLVIVAALLTAGAGFCLFDTDGDHHDAVGLDLCTAIVNVTIGAVLFVVLGVVGEKTDPVRWAATPVAVAIPDPPPWR